MDVPGKSLQRRAFAFLVLIAGSFLHAPTSAQAAGPCGKDDGLVACTGTVQSLSMQNDGDDASLELLANFAEPADCFLAPAAVGPDRGSLSANAALLLYSWRYRTSVTITSFHVKGESCRRLVRIATACPAATTPPSSECKVDTDLRRPETVYEVSTKTLEAVRKEIGAVQSGQLKIGTCGEVSAEKSRWCLGLIQSINPGANGTWDIVLKLEQSNPGLPNCFRFPKGTTVAVQDANLAKLEIGVAA